MKPIKGFFYLALLVFFIGSGFIGLDAAAVKTIEGLRYIDFDTPYGKIGVGLPDDMAEIEVISGKIAVEPSGRSEKQRAKNEKRLNRYSVDIGGQKAAVGDDWGKWKIPPADNMTVALLDPGGKVVDTVQVPVNPHPPAGGAGDFQCPKVTQGGRLFHINGNFDGNFSNTDVSMGGEKVEKWAESPRKVILETPMDVIGNTTIQYTEGSYKGTCECRNIGVQLHADKLKLHKGDITELSVTVSGLKDLKKRIPLSIKNHTPNIVSLKDEGIFFIKPSDVKPGGIYVYKSVAAGIMAGNFNISARVVYDSPPAVGKPDTSDTAKPTPEEVDHVVNRAVDGKKLGKQLLREIENFKDEIKLETSNLSEHVSNLLDGHRILEEDIRVMDWQNLELIRREGITTENTEKEWYREGQACAQDLMERTRSLQTGIESLGTEMLSGMAQMEVKIDEFPRITESIDKVVKGLDDAWVRGHDMQEEMPQKMELVQLELEVMDLCSELNELRKDILSLRVDIHHIIHKLLLHKILLMQNKLAVMQLQMLFIKWYPPVVRVDPPVPRPKPPVFPRAPRRPSGAAPSQPPKVTAKPNCALIGFYVRGGIGPGQGGTIVDVVGKAGSVPGGAKVLITLPKVGSFTVTAKPDGSFALSKNTGNVIPFNARVQIVSPSGPGPACVVTSPLPKGAKTPTYPARKPNCGLIKFVRRGGVGPRGGGFIIDVVGQPGAVMPGAQVQLKIGGVGIIRLVANPDGSFAYSKNTGLVIPAYVEVAQYGAGGRLSASCRILPSR
jgi:hypothetical protein